MPWIVSMIIHLVLYLAQRAGPALDCQHDYSPGSVFSTARDKLPATHTLIIRDI